MTRLFIALLPPASVQTDLAALATPLPGLRWIAAERIHLTLRFIGEVEPATFEAYASALARVTVEPFVLPVGTVGVFPQRGPARVLWVGAGTGHTRLYQLRKQVDDALLSVDPALDVERFHPHFTIGRIGESHVPKELSKFLQHHGSFEAPPFRVTEFHLMGSDPSPVGENAYRVIKSFALREPE